MGNLIAAGFFIVLICAVFGLTGWFCKEINTGTWPVIVRAMLLPIGLLAFYLAALALALFFGVFLFTGLMEVCKSLGS